MARTRKYDRTKRRRRTNRRSRRSRTRQTRRYRGQRGGMLSKAAPEPALEATQRPITVQQLRGKLKTLIQEQTDAGSFRNAGFVVYLIDTLIDQYLEANQPERSMAVAAKESVMNFYDRFKKKESSEVVTEAVTKVLPIPKFVVRQVYSRVVPGAETKQGLLESLANTVTGAATDTVSGVTG